MGHPIGMRLRGADVAIGDAGTVPAVLRARTAPSGVKRAPPGMNGADEAEATEVSVDSFVAVAVNVYGVPFVRPDTVQPAIVTAVQVKLPGDEVTEYEVIDDPPVDAGAVQETAAFPLAGVPATALTAVGASGATA